MSQQVENDQKVPENEDKEKAKLDVNLALKRFIWLRSLDPVFDNNFRDYLTFETHQDVKEYIAIAAKADPITISNILRKQKSNEEALSILAYCLRELKTEPACVELRTHFTEIVTTSMDLLIFMKFFNKLSFSAGIRSCLAKFYESKSPAELLEMIFGSRKYEKLDHGKIIRKLHLKSENSEKQEIFSATFKDYKKISEDSQTSTTLKKILALKDLKRCTDVTAVVEILKKKEINFKLRHLPTFALKSGEVIELILPNLSICEIIENLPKFAHHKLLKDNTSKKISNALSCSAKTVHEAKINPVQVFDVIRKLTGPEVPVKKEEAEGTEKKEKKIMHPLIVQKLKNIFNHSLSEQSKTGCRFFVTLDVRKFSKRQHDIVGMKNISCQELQTIVALTLLKTEKEVTLMSFSDDKNKLKPIAWTKETSFEKAMEIYEKDISEKPKTKENIKLPMRKAAEEKKQVDVFVTFVSSVGRSMGKNAKPPMDALQTYQKAMKLNKSRLVVINLTRKASDFKFDVKSKGILEIVGFSPESMQAIEAFAKNCFY